MSNIKYPYICNNYKETEAKNLRGHRKSWRGDQGGVQMIEIQYSRMKFSNYKSIMKKEC